MYLLDFENGILIDTLVRLFKVCDYEIPLYPSYNGNDKDSISAVLRECLTANLKVLINLSHDSNQISKCFCKEYNVYEFIIYFSIILLSCLLLTSSWLKNWTKRWSY